jgi:hypothetical protein
MITINLIKANLDGLPRCVRNDESGSASLRLPRRFASRNNGQRGNPRLRLIGE